MPTYDTGCNESKARWGVECPLVYFSPDPGSAATYPFMQGSIPRVYPGSSEQYDVNTGKPYEWYSNADVGKKVARLLQMAVLSLKLLQLRT